MLTNRAVPRRPAAGLCLLAALLTGCSSGGGEEEPSPPAAEPSAAAPEVGQRIEEKVDAVLGGVELTLEVADETPERAVGLMGRTEVPDGSGMVFLFDAPVSSSFYMFQVPIPLRATFVRDGTVVGVIDMAPCQEQQAEACPLYGPGEPYDVVVETAPEALPDLEVGARLEPARPGA